MEAGLNRYGKIVCTQPRKVACLTLSKRISQEMNIEENTLISYRVGMEKKNLSEEEKKKRYDAVKKSKLVFMTDKYLLNLYKRDKNLKSYSCVIVDEAHERSLFTDILLCELKKLVAKRSATNNPLKLIIMSATIDHEKMSKYFDNCPVINVPGQMYPVEIIYEKMKPNYVDHSINKLKYVIRGSDRHPGDILVFLTSQDELSQAVKKCEALLNELGKKNDYVCLKLYGKMDADEQAKVFDSYQSKTKIIFATNVAETSLTIDGVRTIIDSGRVKERVFDQIRNISLLKVNLISQSSATQRKGRAGRTASGKCYRLYDESDFYKMDFIVQPEIFKIHLGLVILQLLSCGIDDPLAYDLIDKPDRELMVKTLNNLISLKLVESDLKLSVKGKLAAEMFLEPSISRIVLEGLDLNIAYETSIIAAMLSVSNILFNHSSNKEDKSLSLLKMCKTEGDLISMMEMFKEYKKQKSFSQKKEWCTQNHLTSSTFRQAEQCFTEIWSVIKRSPLFRKEIVPQQNLYPLLLNAICAGLQLNLAYFNGTSNGIRVYKLVELNQEAFIHPSSVLHVLGESDFDDRFLLFTEIFRKEKLYIKNVTPVNINLLQNYNRNQNCTVAVYETNTQSCHIYSIMNSITHWESNNFKEAAIKTGSFNNTMDSLILTSNEAQKIHELGAFSSDQKFNLLYRATRDGFRAFDFHSKSDGFLNTLTIVKSTNGYVFGGFTTQSWHGTGYRADLSAFILSVRRNVTGFNTATDARRFNVTYENNAIVTDSNRGPIFGGGHNIVISDTSNMNNNSFSSFGHCYQYPSEYTSGSYSASNYLTGCMIFSGDNCYFSTVEIEVFQLVNKSSNEN